MFEWEKHTLIVPKKDQMFFAKCRNRAKIGSPWLHVMTYSIQISLSNYNDLGHIIY